MVVIHGLDAEPARAGHAREVHADAAEEAGRELLGLDVHRDARVLVEKRAGLEQDALARREPPFEDVAVAVEEQQARRVCASTKRSMNMPCPPKRMFRSPLMRV